MSSAVRLSFRSSQGAAWMHSSEAKGGRTVAQHTGVAPRRWSRKRTVFRPSAKCPRYGGPPRRRHHQSSLGESDQAPKLPKQDVMHTPAQPHGKVRNTTASFVGGSSFGSRRSSQHTQATGQRDPQWRRFGSVVAVWWWWRPAATTTTHLPAAAGVLSGDLPPSVQSTRPPVKSTPVSSAPNTPEK